MRNYIRTFPALLLAACFLVMAWGGPLKAQSVTLSPEQQRLLDQLPASQRDAALRQLRQFAQQSSRGSIPPADTRTQSDVTIPDSDQTSSITGDTQRLKPRSVVVVSANLKPAEDLRGAVAVERLDDTVSRLQRGNPYTLDDLGKLSLPGVNPVSLAGLNELQASLRLQADPALRNIEINLTLLPLESVGLEALQPFGYALFERKSPTTPDSSGVPVPADYVIGSGDSLHIQLFGNRNVEYELAVGRDGSIQFPEIGPLQVGGMSFGQLRDYLRQHVSEQLIGTQASVSMGDLRLIQVFLVGDVNEPGSYTVGSLSTITSVLTAGGGIAQNGSLRRIQLKRSGQVLSTLDVYDLLLRGDTSQDVRVQSGDVVFVPPVGTRVTVMGEVKRPAIYEYRGAADVGDVITIAGGLLSSALSSEIKIERNEPGTGLLTISAAADTKGTSKVKIRDGDIVHVPAGADITENSVQLVGNVQRPDYYQWSPGLRLSDLIPDSRTLKPGSDLHYVLIRREPRPNIGPTILSADLAAAWQLKESVVDLELQARDTVYVFDLSVGREQFIAPLIDELELRSSITRPVPVANIGGSVNAPGKFPIEEGMHVADLIRAGGGLSQSAYSDEAELTRYTVGPDGSRKTTIITVALGAALRGDSSANLPLHPFDYLNVRETPNWRDVEFIEIVGEVEFPGRYPIRQGETLASVIDRAGGLTALAFSKGSVFTRESLKAREREQIKVLAARLESDLASTSLLDAGHTETLNIGQSLLKQLRTTQPVGRLVINLDNTVVGETPSDIFVRHGDTLQVPMISQDVTVLGEVQYATSHVFEPGLTRDDYIQRSGGTTVKADKKRIYVVRANGKVVATTRSRFFSRSSGTQIEPGDTIVVPLDTDRIRPLTLWTNVTQILYNLAIAARAASGF